MKPKKAKRPVISPGDWVLFGSSYHTLPGDFIHGQVLWADKGGVLVAHSRQSGQPFRQYVEMDEVRAKGTVAELLKIQDDYRKRVRAVAQKMRAAAHQLQSQREKMWKLVEQLNREGMKIFPEKRPTTEDPVAGIEGGL